MDTVSKEKRSEIMRRVKSMQTKPELKVRKLLFSMGYRYRLHMKDLPGKPDIVFTKKKKIIFVHGCFWHQHPGCKKKGLPKSNQAFWKSKFDKNIKRDSQNILILNEMGWKVLVIWECELKEDKALSKKISDFLNDSKD